MKELLDKLLNGEGKLSLLLLQAKAFAEEAKDEEFLEFINDEMNGYSEKDLPEYRKIKANIIGTIKDSYGQVIRQGETINFSVLSKSIGFDLAEAHIPDGIGFIEDGLEAITSQMVERPLHNDIVIMLNKTFKHNNPRYNLTSASHEFGKAAIQFILTKVRQELIIGLQKISKSNKSKLNNISEVSNSSDKKSVFVTYAWENEVHNDRVISFVDFLRKNGYNATMDRKESQEDTSTDFNQMMIAGIQNSEKVIVVLSEKYKERADTFTGGVGTEFRIIFEQLKTYSNKFIFVSFGDKPTKLIVPTAIGGRDILNLKKDQDETEFNQLFAKLNSENTIVFSDVNKEKPIVKKKDIKPFKL